MLLWVDEKASELGRNTHLVGKAPEQQRHDDGSPKLGHDIKEAECPVAQDGNRPCKPRPRPLQQPLGELCAPMAHVDDGDCVGDLLTTSGLQGLMRLAAMLW